MNLTQLKAAKNAQHKVVTHLEKAGVTGPILRDARNKYSMYVQMVREEWFSKQFPYTNDSGQPSKERSK